MTQLMNLVLAAILWLFRLVMAVIGTIGLALRDLMDRLAVPAGLQQIVLIVVLIVLIIAALRLTGRLFGVLIAIFLVLLLLHVLLPQLGVAPPARI